MSGDLESLLRSEMAERAEAAPATFDDPGLADLAIAGAGRIRRRRRVNAAVSGAGLLVLGAAAFVWQPWVAHDPHEGVIAGDTSIVEAQTELDMEFVVRQETAYEVLNEDGVTVALGEERPDAVYRLADAYMAETPSQVTLTSLDGTSAVPYEKPTEETYTKVNTGGTEFALISPNADYTQEEYQLLDVTLAAAAGEVPDEGVVSFTTNYALTLEDWSATTAFFVTDLTSTTGGNAGSPYYFNAEHGWGLESVGQAGFDAVAVADSSDPSYVCVADLEADVGVARTSEQCGPVDSTEIRRELAEAAGDETAPDMAAEVSDRYAEKYMYPIVEDFDLGEYEERFYGSMNDWVDPQLRWQMTGDVADETWLLLDASGEEPILSELTPPSGSIMPVLSYI